MAHYAFINGENIVVEVIPGRNENETVNGISDWEAYYSTKREDLRAIRTSYNTQAGQHRLGGTPFRKNYAGIGYTYDETRDAFIPPKPYPSWVLDEETCIWGAPIPQPPTEYDETGEPVSWYVWDEDAGDWMQVVGE